MTETPTEPRRPPERPVVPPSAFRADHRVQRARGVIKAAWWGSAGRMMRAVAGTRGKPADFTPRAAPPPDGFVRRVWAEAFERDAADVAAGLYPPMDGAPPSFTAVLDLLADAREVEQRRRRGGGLEAREEAAASGAYPAYYRQNFHYQTGGWFTAESARRYEAQVETLFAGTAAAMRRRALSLLARAWRTRDQRGLVVLDLACGAGGFLADLGRAFPRTNLLGADLSPAYLGEAARACPRAALVRLNAERLPFADASLDAVTCIYLFHELPPARRRRVAAEIARSLKPDGHLAFADSLQPDDEPRLARLLEAFPAYFHEPYYDSYGETDLRTLFGEAGLSLVAEDRAFLTKAMLFAKAA